MSKFFLLFLMSGLMNLSIKEKYDSKKLLKGTHQFQDLKYQVLSEWIVKQKNMDMINSLLMNMERNIGNLKENMNGKFDKLKEVFNRNAPLKNIWVKYLNKRYSVILGLISNKW